jgi:hypothetical protein
MNEKREFPSGECRRNDGTFGPMVRKDCRPACGDRVTLSMARSRSGNKVRGSVEFRKDRIYALGFRQYNN